MIPAGVGSLALTLLWATAFSNFEEIFALYGLDGAERIVVLLCYAPLLLWGPLLAAVTASYAKRVSTGGPLACSSQHPAKRATAWRQGQVGLSAKGELPEQRRPNRRADPGDLPAWLGPG